MMLRSCERSCTHVSKLRGSCGSIVKIEMDGQRRQEVHQNEDRKGRREKSRKKSTVVCSIFLLSSILLTNHLAMSLHASSSRQWTHLSARISKHNILSYPQHSPGPSSGLVNRSLHTSTASNEASSSSNGPRRSRPSSSRDAAKAYDGLLSSPDAFSRSDAARIPRKGNATRDRPGYPFASSGPRYTPAKDSGTGKLTSSEVGMWTTILQDAFELTNKPDQRRISSFEDRGEDGFRTRIDDFARRNDLLASFRFRGKNTERKKRTLGGGTGRFASLPEGEGLMPDISPEERDAGVDEAVQAMNLCNNEAELWSWAAVNVWGFDESQVESANYSAPSRQKIDSSEAEEATDEADPAATSNTVSPPSPRYGVATAFYPSVLHRLIVQFRERLHAPTSALAVPRITRALGTRSLVLGCTSELYTEAIKARWEGLKDLRGCLEVLKEAKDLGFLVRDKNDPKPGEDTKSLSGVVNAIQSDVRRLILSKRTPEVDSSSTRAESFPALSDLPYQYDKSTSSSQAVDDSALSLAALDALRIANEMSTLLGMAPTSPSPRSRRPPSNYARA